MVVRCGGCGIIVVNSGEFWRLVIVIVVASLL